VIVSVHGYRNITPIPKFTVYFVPRQVLGQTTPITAKKWAVKICVGQFAGQNGCTYEKPGSIHFATN
jgi:hypothetical protein